MSIPCEIPLPVDSVRTNLFVGIYSETLYFVLLKYYEYIFSHFYLYEETYYP